MIPPAKRGRPRKSTIVNNRSIQTQIRFTEEELRAILTAAKREGFNISQWIRYAIRQYLNQQGIAIQEPPTNSNQQGQ